MLLRICLIMAILGGGAVVAVNFVMVKKTIETTIHDRDTEKGQKVAAQKELATTKKDRDTAKTTLTNTIRTLTTTSNSLNAANSKVDNLQKQTTDLQANLTKAIAARDQAQGELTEWHQLPLTPQKVIQLTNDLNKITMEFAGASLETSMLNKENERIRRELETLTKGATNDVVELPPGLKGKVLAVDPKYDFVILDIGEDKGVLRRGIMMVARDGRLIGKVQIASVANNQSVANIMPAWRRGDVMEGDEVLY
jgi:hypothetical protein